MRNAKFVAATLVAALVGIGSAEAAGQKPGGRKDRRERTEQPAAKQKSADEKAIEAATAELDRMLKQANPYLDALNAEPRACVRQLRILSEGVVTDGKVNREKLNHLIESIVPVMRQFENYGNQGAAEEQAKKPRRRGAPDYPFWRNARALANRLKELKSELAKLNLGRKVVG